MLGEFGVNVFQLIAIGGMIGPILYTLIWILGGILQPDYSHVRDDVSSLLAVGAPNKRLFDIMHVADIVLVIIFFGTLHWAIDGGQGLIVGPACFLLANILELAVALFFPLDEGGEIKTRKAKMHWNLVKVMAILAAVGMLAMWYRLSNTSGWELLGTYSLVSFIASAVTGLFAAKNVGTKIMGLAERLVVTTNVQYIFVLALIVFLTSA
jgi:hypothetical protein